jgi:hypothetical protein
MELLMIKNCVCARCQKDVKIILVESGPHIKAVCGLCLTYIKFVPPRDLVKQVKIKEALLELAKGDKIFLESFLKTNGTGPEEWGKKTPWEKYISYWNCFQILLNPAL